MCAKVGLLEPDWPSPRDGVMGATIDIAVLRSPCKNEGLFGTAVEEDDDDDAALVGVTVTVAIADGF